MYLATKAINDASKAVDATYVNKHQPDLILQLDFYQLTELVDLKPVAHSPFIQSKSEPFADLIP